MITIVPVPSCRTSEDVKGPILQLLEDLNYKPSQPRVFLKPNIVDAVKPVEAVVVDPAVTGGLILALLERGTKEFVIAEGTGFFSREDKNMTHLLEASGYTKLVTTLGKKYGLEVPLINLEKAEREEYNWEFGKILLPKLCRTHAYINIAKMKTHAHTLVTLTLKNQKGLLRFEDKRNFHRGFKGMNTNLHASIKALGVTVKPELAIIDATRALEGTGPTTQGEGQTKVRQLNLCIGGTEMNEIDCAGCQIMGISPGEVKHLVDVPMKFAQRSLPLEKAIANPHFQRPELEVKMGNFRCYELETACTSCQISLSRTFRKVMFVPELRESFVELTKKNPRINIVMGKSSPEFIKGISAKGGKMLFWGNCLKKVAEEYGAAHVPGCAPDHNDAIKVLFELMKKK